MRTSSAEALLCRHVKLLRHDLPARVADGREQGHRNVRRREELRRPAVAQAESALTAGIGALRFEGARIVRRLPVDPSARPLLAEALDGLWIATEQSRCDGSALIRIDPEIGEVIARVGLGGRDVTSLPSVGDELWALAGDGTILVMGS